MRLCAKGTKSLCCVTGVNRVENREQYKRLIMFAASAVILLIQVVPANPLKRSLS